MFSTELFDDKAAPGRRRQPGTTTRTTSTDVVSAAPRRDTTEQPQPRPGPGHDERPLTFDDIARIGDTKADDQDDADGQSSTKGTGSAG